jgi:hypothetical protein
MRKQATSRDEPSDLGVFIAMEESMEWGSNGHAIES